MTIAEALSVVDVLSSCDGLIGPASAGQPIDALRGIEIARRGRRALELLSAFSGDDRAARRLVDEVATALADLPVESVLAAFDTPLGGWDLPAADWPLETVRDNRGDDQRALTLWRHLVGTPLGIGVTLVVPKSAHRLEPIALPHLGILVRAGGPLAVDIRPDGSVGLVWDDGFAMTFPPGRETAMRLPPSALSGRAAVAPHWSGRPVEPQTADIAAAFAGFNPATAAAAAKQMLTAHDDGLAVLAEIWPEAAESADRWLSGWFPVVSDQGIRSHSSPRLPGVLVSSATDVIAAGDVLCHELAHIRLCALLASDSLLSNAMLLGCPSPWRVDPRPLLGVLLGVHAFLDVCEFHRRITVANVPINTRAASQRIYDIQADKIRAGWQTLLDVGEPTPTGAVLLAGLDIRVEAL